jgi:glutamate-1-semialdehyde 2,1-aminomutase
MIAGLTTLELISAPGFHQRLGAMTDLLVDRLGKAAAAAGIELATNHVCGMFGFFFTAERDVDRYDKVMACDVERFKHFFHGMLQEGIYLAPSAFEAGFLSAAHSPADIETTIAAASRVFASMLSRNHQTGS